jgi:protein phosphatase PTC7
LKLKSFKSDELEKVAKKIVDKTVRLSRDPLYYSPFAMSARQNQISMTGGKPDDITLLLARVSK